MASATQTKEKPHGKLFKATEIALGIASFVAIGLSFFPGANEIGAVMQGAITLVQTGMDLATGHKKKAAIDFALGSALTVASIIPVLGAVGNFAKFGILGADGLKIGEGAAKLGALGAETAEVGTGVARGVEAGGKVANETVIGKVFNTIKKPFKAAWELVGKGTRAVGDFLEKHFPTPVNFLKDHLFTPVRDFFAKVSAKLWKSHDAMVVRAAGTAEKPGMLRNLGVKTVEHHQIANGVRTAADVGGFGLSFVNDSPPATAFDGFSDNAKDSAVGDVNNSQWRNRIRAERNSQALANANGATPS